ncbi:hypothetical protein DRN73_02415 [Candidatus Pacearchaeota archaeon]|nr:MAG: hypothetical protein DRN73_02415 [Candidatus Pacearchaeota archaeon]
MKRGTKLFFVFLLIAFVSLSLVSAGWWSNFWGKFSGKATGNIVSNIQCSDTDNGKDSFVRGHIYGVCYDCKKDFGIGKNTYFGYPIGGNSDSCVDDNNNLVSSGNKLMEFYCVDSKGWKREIITCDSGCNDGACVYCNDSDSNDIFKKGFVVSNSPNWISYYGNNVSDSCAFKSGTIYTKNTSCSGDNCYVLEYNCEGNLPKQEPAKCSEGCLDGACIKPEKNCSETYPYPEYHGGSCSPESCEIQGYEYAGCDREWVKTNYFGGGHYEYKEICKKNILSRNCSTDKKRLCKDGSWETCATGCSNGACNPSYPEYLIEKDLGSVNYLRSRLTQDYCDIVDSGSCNMYEAKYNFSSEGARITVGIETHSKVFKNGEAINGFLGEFRRDESIQVDTEAWKGNPYYVFKKVDGDIQDVLLAWYSGTNVVLVAIEHWDIDEIDEDVFDALLDAYFEKYPSDLVFEEIPPVECSDSDGGEMKYEKGTATGENINGQQVSESDQCLGNILIEKICKNGYVSDVFINCENGCEKGACKIICNYGVSDFKPEVRNNVLVLDDLKTTKSVDDVSLLYLDGNQISGFGGDIDEKIATGKNKIIFDLDEDSMFIASRFNENFSESYLMRITNLEEDSNGNSLTIEYKNNGNWETLRVNRKEGDEISLGNITLLIGSIDVNDDKAELKIISENSFLNVLTDFNGNYIGIDDVEGLFFPTSIYYLNIFDSNDNMINRYKIFVDSDNLQIEQACITPTCTNEDEGLYENVTSSYAYDNFGGNISDTCYNASILREAICFEGNVSTLDVFCENGCGDGKCLGESNCSDSDNGLNYFEQGSTVSCIGGECFEALNESCVDENTLWESYCGRNDEVIWQQYFCENGCENGSCNSPEKAACEPVTFGGPEILPKTRLIVNGSLSYCNPLTLDYELVKALNESCINDYECESNVCIEGKCSSIRGELESQRKILEEQTSLLQEIRCWLRDFFNVQDYDECLNESIGG